MIQGTASHVGKSLLATALCRIFSNAGFRVAPFKAQNMSLNAAVTIDGGEIGRAQMLQSIAARTTATVHMNPILLKPQGRSTSQVIVHGRALRVTEAADYYRDSRKLWPLVEESLNVMAADYDVVVIEGAGGAAEINLRGRDIANMRVATHLRCPVLLVGDVERGGVFASLLGTTQLLADDERALVRGFVINKFRGDPALLDPGPEMLAQLTGIDCLGVIPYMDGMTLPEEDSLGIPDNTFASGESGLDIAVIRLPHISNFDDFDPLRRYQGANVRFVAGASQLGDPHVVVLPGSKSTVADITWLRATGIASAMLSARDRGAHVIGICGGYQMLGQIIGDPDAVESPRAMTEGLGLLDVATTFERGKRTTVIEAQVTAEHGMLRGCAGEKITGYEIHHGVSTRCSGGVASAFVALEEPRQELGVLDVSGRVMGTYLHGMFGNDVLCERILANVAAANGVSAPRRGLQWSMDAELDRLAGHLRKHLLVDPVDLLADIETGNAMQLGK